MPIQLHFLTKSKVRLAQSHATRAAEMGLIYHALGVAQYSSNSNNVPQLRLYGL